jgi:glutathione-specific gamma-glutamylcyclotransferase
MTKAMHPGRLGGILADAVVDQRRARAKRTIDGALSGNTVMSVAAVSFGRRLVMPRALRLTRDLVARLPSRVDERGPVRWTAPSDMYYAATASKLLSKLQEDGQFWVFAIGSLIWSRKLQSVEQRPAIVRGWHRSFCLGPDTRHRGNPAAPGLMMSLDRGGQCQGVVFRLDPTDLAASLETLLRNEPPMPPRWVTARTPQGTVRAIAFALKRSHFMYVGGLSETEVADRLARAVGHIGSMADYLLNTILHLEEVGIHDRALWRMQALVAERLERLPAKCPEAEILRRWSLPEYDCARQGAGRSSASGFQTETAECHTEPRWHWGRS